MAKDNDIHPALMIVCFVMFGITVGTAMAMEKFPLSPVLDITKLEAEDLIYRRSRLLQPRIEVK